jgi:hypothetical protein
LSMAFVKAPFARNSFRSKYHPVPQQDQISMSTVEYSAHVCA